MGSVEFSAQCHAEELLPGDKLAKLAGAIPTWQVWRFRFFFLPKKSQCGLGLILLNLGSSWELLLKNENGGLNRLNQINMRSDGE